MRRTSDIDIPGLPLARVGAVGLVPLGPLWDSRMSSKGGHLGGVTRFLPAPLVTEWGYRYNGAPGTLARRLRRRYQKASNDTAVPSHTRNACVQARKRDADLHAVGLHITQGHKPSGGARA